jgi:hypothetical protein
MNWTMHKPINDQYLGDTLTAADLSEMISKLEHLVRTNPNENFVFDEGQRVLNIFRDMWKNNREIFDDNQIIKLKELSDKISSRYIM